MNKGTEALIASIKPDLKLAKDKSLPHSVSFPAIDRLSDVLTLDVLSELIAALEQAQQESKVQLETITNVTELWNEQQQRIAELESQRKLAFMACNRWRDKCAEAESRVAELENDEVRQRLANAEHQLYMAELAKHNLRASRKAQFRKRLAAERRVAELEASKLSVKLPAYRNSPDMHTKQYYEAVGFNQGLDACAEEIRAAGGTVKGE